ncbi:hypothetical protein EDC01DRAFT_732677 [Geopyxis carbonaria]|nr:hypothetical protein EDC01DRAFT_732677 [Geopyxis carbonaria]
MDDSGLPVSPRHSYIAPSTPTSTTSTGPHQRLRTSKACEECRKRKIKCHGQSPVPCEYCRSKGLACTYRTQTRVRRPRAALLHAGNIAHAFEHATRPAPPPAAPEEQAHGADMMEETVYAGVSATENEGSSRTMTLYYGPSSNFSLIQHIHARLGAGASAASSTGDDDEPDPAFEDGLDTFQYRDIFFGRHSDRPETALQYPRGRRTAAATAAVNLLFLPVPLAQKFLDGFLTTIQKHLPFVEEAAAREMLAILYGMAPPTVRAMDTAERAIILAVLSLGATLTDEMAWAATLFARAKATADELADTVNVQACQIQLLLAHYHQIQGAPNSVYLAVGTAMRKALAAGLHKETLAAAPGPHTAERRLTFWSIYILESTICYGLGRPAAVADCDITTPPPLNHAFFSLLIKLAQIYARAQRTLYGARRGSLHSLYTAAQAIYSDLTAFRAALPPALAFGPNITYEPGPAGVDRLFIGNWFYHATLLNFRPFLVFHSLWRRAGRSSSQLPPWLFTACNLCVSAARELLATIAHAVAANDLVRRLIYNGFYMECGAFLLVFNMLRDGSARAVDTAAVRSALATIRKMDGHDALNSSEFAIRRMLGLLEAAADEAFPETSMSPESGGGGVRANGAAGAGADGGEKRKETAAAAAAAAAAGVDWPEPVWPQGDGFPTLPAQHVGAVDAMTWSLDGETKPLDFDLAEMDLDCWLAMDGVGTL